VGKRSEEGPKALTFQVTWIGFWFNLPGVTADPTQVAQNFFNTGYDVVIRELTPRKPWWWRGKGGRRRSRSGPFRTITRERARAPWTRAWGSLLQLGPTYIHFIKDAMEGKFKQEWLWNAPDWKDINNPDTSAVGFLAGGGLSKTAQASTDTFIKDLGSGKVQLLKGSGLPGREALPESRGSGNGQAGLVHGAAPEGMAGESKAKK